MKTNHYANLALVYDDYYRYSNDYVNYFTGKIVDELPINKDETIVELGAGTGIFAREILDKIPSVQMICVDNSAVMLNRSGDRRMQLICQDAVDFALQNYVYDKVFMKEFIHHIDKADRKTLFWGIHRQLKGDGAVLILMEPGRLNYPLFNEALNRFESNQPSRLEIIKDLELAGFTTSFSVISYPINLPKAKYIDMVRRRYMSILESFTDEELENGIRSIDESHNNDELEFLEIFYCIRGIK